MFICLPFKYHRIPSHVIYCVFSSSSFLPVDVRLPSNFELYMQNIFLVGFALAMVCYAFPWDLLVVLPLGAVFVVLAVMFAPVMQQLKFVDSITRSPYLSHLATSMEGMATIHAFGQTQRFFKQ